MSNLPITSSSTHSFKSWSSIVAPIVLLILSGIWFYRERTFEAGVAVGAAVLNAVAAFKDYLRPSRILIFLDRSVAIILAVFAIFGLGFVTRDIMFPSPSSSPQPKVIALDATSNYSIRLYNCDDACRIFVNNSEIPTLEVPWNTDSRWVDISKHLSTTKTTIRFDVFNTKGGITYGFQIKKNKENVILEDVKCGLVGSYGCENDRIFPYGVVYSQEYVLQKP